MNAREKKSAKDLDPEQLRLQAELLQRGAVAALSRWNDAGVVLDGLKKSGCFGKANAKQRDAHATACEILGHLFWREVQTEGNPFSASETDVAEAHSTLVSMLHDPEEGVRMQAAAALGKMGRPNALEPLMPVLKDASPLVVEAAVNAIDVLDWSEFLEAGVEIQMKGPLLKRVGINGVHIKMLILTKPPRARLFYVDADTFEAKNLAMVAEVKDPATTHVLHLVRKGRAIKTQCVIHTAKQWSEAVHKTPVKM